MPLTLHIKPAQSPLSIISLNRITRLQDSLSKTLTANLFFSFLHLHPISDQALVSFFHDVLSPLTSPLSSPPGCLSDDCGKLLPVSLRVYHCLFSTQQQAHSFQNAKLNVTSWLKDANVFLLFLK